METHVNFKTPKPNEVDDKQVSALINQGKTKKEIKEITGLHFGYINRYLKERAPDSECDPKSLKFRGLR